MSVWYSVPFPPTVLRGKPTHSRMSPFKALEDSDMSAHTHTSNTFFGAKRMSPLKSPEDSCITVRHFLSVFLRWRPPKWSTVLMIDTVFLFFCFVLKNKSAELTSSYQTHCNTWQTPSKATMGGSFVCIFTHESDISAKDPYIFPQKNPICVCNRGLVDHRRLHNVYFGHTSLTFLDTKNPYIFPQKSPTYVCKRDLEDHKQFLEVYSGTKVLHLCTRALCFHKRDLYMDANKPFCTRDLAAWKRDHPSTEGTWSHDDKTALRPKRLQHPAARCNRDCNTLQHAATETATPCSTLQHIATLCNTLQQPNLHISN